MSYMISYDTNGTSKFRKIIKWTKTKIFVVAAAGVLFFAIAFPQVRQWFRKAVFPGNADVTQEAVSRMISDIQDGSDVKDALTTFCQEILEHAG